MTKKKNALVLGVLLLVAVTFGVVSVTYSRYISESTGTAEAKVATWAVKVNETNIIDSQTFNFDESYITWADNAKIADGYIAPGRTGTMKIKLDTTGTKVAVKYTVSIDYKALENYSQIKVTKVNGEAAPADGVYTGTIGLDDIGELEIPVEITWTDEEATNESDTTIGAGIENFELPVIVTVEQDV